MKRRLLTLAIFLLLGAVVNVAVAWGSAFLSVDPSQSGAEWVIGNPALAVRPIWPGFAINTIFFAATLWLLVCGPFALRRHIRRKRTVYGLRLRPPPRGSRRLP